MSLVLVPVWSKDSLFDNEKHFIHKTSERLIVKFAWLDFLMHAFDYWKILSEWNGFLHLMSWTILLLYCRWGKRMSIKTWQDQMILTNGTSEKQLPYYWLATSTWFWSSVMLFILSISVTSVKNEIVTKTFSHK